MDRRQRQLSSGPAVRQLLYTTFVIARRPLCFSAPTGGLHGRRVLYLRASAGTMLWLRRKKLNGSYFCLSAWRRSAPAAHDAQRFRWKRCLRAGYGRAARGRVSVNVEPRPSSLRAVRSPPMPRARSRLMARPRPEPSFRPF